MNRVLLILFIGRKSRNWTSIRCSQCGNVERFLIPKDPFIKIEELTANVVVVNDDIKVLSKIPKV